MKRSLLNSLLAFSAALAVGAPAWAQPAIVAPQVAQVLPGDLFQDLPNGVIYGTNYYVSAAKLQGWLLGGNIIRSTEKPVLTACITGGGTIAGADNAFVLTGGSTASTSCVATFPTAYVTRPVCSVTSETAYGTTTASYAVSTTAITITQASGSSNVYDVICMAQPGG